MLPGDKYILFYHISLIPSQNEKYLRQSCRKNKTHFMFNNHFFEKRTVYENMQKINVNPDRPHMTL